MPTYCRAWFLTVLVMMIACRSAPVTSIAEPTAPATVLSQPPAVTFGVDLTYPDGRLLQDPRFAAVLVTAAGDLRLFDDIGRMIVAQSAADEPTGALWVHDYEGDSWLSAEDAVYVASPNLVTPRGSGLLAVASPDRAEQLARDLGGQILSLAAIPAYLAAASGEPLPAPSSGLELGGLLEADGK